MANERARSLRKSMTPQEVRLWLRLRLLRPQGLHFRRQVPIAGYIVDFACLRARLAIEVDGEHHGFDGHRRYDAGRDAALSAAGLHVIRFWNNEINANVEAVVETIFHAATTRLEGRR